jgi:hypothetical protein
MLLSRNRGFSFAEYVFAVLVLALLSGCCSTKQGLSPVTKRIDGSHLEEQALGCTERATQAESKKIEAIYFSNLFPCTSLASSSSDIGKETDIAQQLKEIQEEHTWESKVSEESNSLECSYKLKDSSENGSISCQYLGNWKGYDIVSTVENTGGSGVFSSVYLYSINKGKLIIHRSGPGGDRGCDGFRSDLIYDGKGKIYFYSRVSNYTLLKQAGIDEKIVDSEGFTPATGYEIVGKCVYDIEKDEKKVLSITAFSSQNKNEKINSLIVPKMYKGVAIFDENETKEFFVNLRKLYEK